MRLRDGSTRTSFVRTPEADAFRQAVAIFARGDYLTPATQKERRQIVYRIELVFTLGENERLDIDNGLKVTLDALQAAGVIHSDARVGELTARMVWNNRKHPSTHIHASVVEPKEEQ